MPWYYYSGAKPTAIPVGGGEVRSVRPHTKVEIHPSSANDVQIRTLSKMGVLKRCGKPPREQASTVVEGSVPPPEKSGKGEPFKFHEFLVKEGQTRKGRPDPEESVAPVDRGEPKDEKKSTAAAPAGSDEGEKVADADDGDVQESEGSGSRSKRRTRRRRSTS